MRQFGKDKVFVPGKNKVFVFGSNLAGVHGGGAAWTAMQFYGAEWGNGEGLQTPPDNNYTALSYALPTKDMKIQTLPLADVDLSVSNFYWWYRIFGYKYDEIFVTKVGCGLAGFSEKEISGLFSKYPWPANVTLPVGWRL